MRLRLDIQYEGTDFHGWQAQRTGARTVQGDLQLALARVAGGRDGAAGAPSVIHGAGRTDAGVHALGQVAHVDVEKDLAPATWLRALNANLGRDVRVVAAEEVGADFHARKSAVNKLYQYRVWTAAVVSPFERRYVAHAPRAHDVGRMRSAASILVGRHDFEAFTVADRETSTTVRDLRRLDVDVSGAVMTISAEADGFLRAMVRTLAGVLLAVGDGRMSVDAVARALESGRRDLAGATAPAAGLTLVRVDY